MMKRFLLAVRVLLGLPLSGVRIDETLLLDKGKESESDYTKEPPFDLAFGGVLRNGPPKEVIRDGRFRVCVFVEKWTGKGCGCGRAPRWLVLELHDGRKWHHILTMHQSHLPVMQDGFHDLERRLPPEPRSQL